MLVLGVMGLLAAIDGSEPVTMPAALVVGLVLATIWVAGERRRTTARGLELLDGERGGRRSLGHVPSPAEVPMAVAVYGAGALWAADPGIADAWSAGRDGESGHGSGFGFSGGGAGCGAGARRLRLRRRWRRRWRLRWRRWRRRVRRRWP